MNCINRNKLAAQGLGRKSPHMHMPKGCKTHKTLNQIAIECTVSTKSGLFHQLWTMIDIDWAISTSGMRRARHTQVLNNLQHSFSSSLPWLKAASNSNNHTISLSYVSVTVICTGLPSSWVTSGMSFTYQAPPRRAKGRPRGKCVI